MIFNTEDELDEMLELWDGRGSIIELLGWTREAYAAYVESRWDGTGDFKSTVEPNDATIDRGSSNP